MENILAKDVFTPPTLLVINNLYYEGGKKKTGLKGSRRKSQASREARTNQAGIQAESQLRK